MIRLIVVVRNNLKPFKPASLPAISGARQGFWVKWLFLFSCPIVPLTIASAYMGSEGENIGQSYTRLITLADCVRGIAQHRATGVRSSLYGVETHLSEEASAIGMGLEWAGSSPLDKYCLNIN